MVFDTAFFIAPTLAPATQRRRGRPRKPRYMACGSGDGPKEERRWQRGNSTRRGHGARGERWRCIVSGWRRQRPDV